MREGGITSKQRVIRAVNHEETDKVPVELGGSIQSTIHAYAYAGLKKALGIESGDVEIMDSYILAAIVEDSVRDALQIDTVPILCPLENLDPDMHTDSELRVQPPAKDIFVTLRRVDSRVQLETVRGE